jgi:hypothetical protein
MTPSIAAAHPPAGFATVSRAIGAELEASGRPTVVLRLQVPGDRSMAYRYASELRHRMAAARRLPDAGSALTAGAIALGLSIGEIESNPLRVLRMAFLILTGGPAFDDRINKFNRSMNRGGELAAWFTAQFGSTQCREITGAAFSSTAEVEAYCQGSGITKCEMIAQKVADHVQLMLGAGCNMAARLTDTPARSLSICVSSTERRGACCVR